MTNSITEFPVVRVQLPEWWVTLNMHVRQYEWVWGNGCTGKLLTQRRANSGFCQENTTNNKQTTSFCLVFFASFFFGLGLFSVDKQLTWTEGSEDLVPECSEFTELLHSKAVLTGWLAGDAI